MPSYFTQLDLNYDNCVGEADQVSSYFQCLGGGVLVLWVWTNWFRLSQAHQIWQAGQFFLAGIIDESNIKEIGLQSFVTVIQEFLFITNYFLQEMLIKVK